MTNTPPPDAVVVRATPSLAGLLRPLLARACAATGARVRLELVANGPLFRALRDERAAPRVDVIATFGPFVAELCAREGLLQPAPADAAPPLVLAGELTAHDEAWSWQAFSFAPATLVGRPPLTSLATAMRSAPRLVVPDPLRSEAGLLVLLASLDQIRQRQRNVELGWQAWERRDEMGLVQTEEADAALAAVRDGRASHALLTGPLPAQDSPTTVINDLPPIPHAVGLVQGAPHEASARQLLAWLASAEAAAVVDASGGLSAWRAGENGLGAVANGSRPLDVGWCFDQYRGVRAEWGRKPFAVRASEVMR